jgi:hypothetical protein
LQQDGTVLAQYVAHPFHFFWRVLRFANICERHVCWLRQLVHLDIRQLLLEFFRFQVGTLMVPNLFFLVSSFCERSVVFASNAQVYGFLNLLELLQSLRSSPRLSRLDSWFLHLGRSDGSVEFLYS